MKRLVLGTRGSQLARRQAEQVRDALLQAHDDLAPEDVELKLIRTRGDRNRQAALHEMIRPQGAREGPPKGLFTKELEDALLDGRIDLAVHSLKDLPTELPAGLALGAVPQREDPADAVVAKDRLTLAMLPRGVTVLAGSLRRAAQLLHLRGDLEVVPVRGNVATRLHKLDISDAKAIILARAGLIRLGLGRRISERLDPEQFLPACGQGALGVEIRAGDAAVAERVAAIDHAAARQTASAERAVLAALAGGCQVPVGAYARLSEGQMLLTAMVASLDGARLVRQSVSGACADESEGVALGRSLAEKLLGEGAQDILDALRS